LEAIRCKDVGGEAIPLNDLYVLVLFARTDEEYRDLRDANFVWTAVALTNERLKGMARERASRNRVRSLGFRTGVLFR
jgi:hypothetical protein